MTSTDDERTNLETFIRRGKANARTPNIDQRWARRETVWEVVGGESK